MCFDISHEGDPLFIYQLPFHFYPKIKINEYNLKTCFFSYAYQQYISIL